ncbi:MAG: TylF/MycF/NovP-related O-methyltransferase [Parvibaculum sp.]|nr:TylF/MycF/NovP-related O-methyltransferase [Parvibaculum sp.]
MRFDRGMLSKITQLGVHPLFLVRRTAQASASDNYIVCPTQNEASRFITDLMGEVGYSNSLLLRGLTEALSGRAVEAANLFGCWLFAAEDEPDISCFIGLPDGVSHPLYWGYPAYELTSVTAVASDKAPVLDRVATLSLLFVAYASSTGNDALRHVIADAMALALCVGTTVDQARDCLSALQGYAKVNPHSVYIDIAIDSARVKIGELPIVRVHNFWKLDEAKFDKLIRLLPANSVLFPSDPAKAAASDESLSENINRLSTGPNDEATKFFNAVVDHVSARSHISHFWGDRLLTLDKAAGFMEEPDFTAAFEAFPKDHPYDQYMGSGSIAWRLHTLVWAARIGLSLDGDFVECGTFRGDMAAFICAMCDIAQARKAFHLFDSFDGFSPSLSSEDDYPGNNGFLNYSNQFYKKTGLYESVLSRFQDSPQVKVHKGFLPEALKGNAPDKVSFLHVDLNSWRAELGCLNVLYDRVTPGGIIIFDDYGWKLFGKQKEAADQFMSSRGNAVLELPTGQGLVVKS